MYGLSCVICVDTPNERMPSLVRDKRFILDSALLQVEAERRSSNRAGPGLSVNGGG